MSVDKVKALKIENPALGGTQTDFGPTETNPAQDYLAAKGIALENSDNTTIRGDSGVMRFKDTVVTTEASLEDAIERLKLKTVDLSVLTNGYVLTWDNTNSKFYLASNGSATGGVVPPFIFSKSGGTGTGAYLKVGEVLTSKAGHPVIGNNYIASIYATNSTTVGSVTRVQIQKRTGVSTFTDISGAYVDIASGQYKSTNTGLKIAIGADEELSCYNKSGDNLVDPVVAVYIYPQ